MCSTALTGAPKKVAEKKEILGGGFKDFLFPSLLGEMIQFD